MNKIYCLQNLINGHRYVGFTSRNVEERIVEHFKCARLGYNGSPVLYDAIRKYGKENFKWHILYEGDDAIEKEDEFVQLLGDYNTAPGGGGLLLERTEKHKTNISKALLGHTISQETREKIRQTLKISIAAKKARENLWCGNRGKKHTEAHKEKLRLLNIGEKNAFYGKTHSEESKQKMRGPRGPQPRRKKNGISSN